MIYGAVACMLAQPPREAFLAEWEASFCCDARLQRSPDAAADLR